MTTILASYPRSGNHLVRFLIEFLTKRPTEGCLGNPNDRPICTNHFLEEPDILKNVNPNNLPIAVKHHSVNEIKQNIHNGYLIPSSLLLIIRDPIDAISAEITIKHSRKNLSQFTKKAQRDVEKYLDLIVYYNNSTFKKEIIFYEQISASNVSSSKSEVKKLMQFFREQIFIENVVDLLASYEKYLSVSASRKGPGAGVRSKGKKYYHLSKLDNEKIKVLLDIVKEKIEQKQLNTFFEKHYPNLFDLNTDYNLINIFQNNGTSNNKKASNSNRKIHHYDNGVQVYDDHLIPEQRQRNQQRNVYEAEEEEIFVDIISSIPKQGCFVNIGAAIGYYPILAKILSPCLTIHAVEPLEKHRNYFIENIQLNGFSVKDFYLHREAISSVSKENQDFLGNGYESRLKRNNDPSQNAIKVKTQTLDDFIDSISYPVDLLKMDINGLESDALKGGKKSLNTGKIQTILIGTNGQDIHKKCIEILKGYNYIIQLDRFNTVQQPDGIIVAHRKFREISKLRAIYQIEEGQIRLNHFKNELKIDGL